MDINKGNPTSRGDAGRAPEDFLSLAAMKCPEHNLSPYSLQLAFVARRVGAIDPATLATIASLCFGSAAR